MKVGDELSDKVKNCPCKICRGRVLSLEIVNKFPNNIPVDEFLIGLHMLIKGVLQTYPAKFLETAKIVNGEHSVIMINEDEKTPAESQEADC
jgi:hypothetical protein